MSLIGFVEALFSICSNHGDKIIRIIFLVRDVINLARIDVAMVTEDLTDLSFGSGWLVFLER